MIDTAEFLLSLTGPNAKVHERWLVDVTGHLRYDCYRLLAQTRLPPGKIG